MKEITRIVTARMTSIVQVEDESEIMTRERCAERFKESMEQEGFDNVVVDDVQDFVRDISESKLPEEITEQTMNRFEKVE